MLLVFTQDGAPIWEVRRRAKASPDDLVTSGSNDSFEAAKAGLIFEAQTLSHPPKDIEGKKVPSDEAQTVGSPPNAF